MNKVVNLKAFKVLKNPLMAICSRLEHHEKSIDLLAINTKQALKQIALIIKILFWSNVVSWLTIGAIIIALFNHSHSITSLL